MPFSSIDPVNPEPDENKPKLPSLEPDDPDIDSLTKLLDRSLRLQTQALAASKLVPVDKKYLLSFATTPSQFYEWRAQAKRVSKRKREEGIYSKCIEGNRIGFRPEELMWNGALELKDCKPSNLTNEIHSLFGRNRFDDCPDHIYDQFVPALRLATLFLTKPICFQFWVTVGLGTRKFDEKGSRRCGYATERIERNVPMTEENTSRLINYIQELDQSTLVHFGFKPTLTLRGSQVWATAQGICDYYIEHPRKPFTAIQRHNVRLHGDFYVAAQRLAQLTHPDLAQQLRFHFFLAVVIVHELAHVVEGAHRQNRPGLTPMMEPFLFDHSIKELGAAWESMMFGGRIQPINGRVDGTHGLSVNDWPGDDDLAQERNRYTFHSIPMGYIESLFQMQTWERKHNLKNWKQFHIPRTGAVSIHLNCFTTMPWKEELHDTAATITQVLDMLDPDDEPPRKRRETRIGSSVIATKDSSDEQRKPNPHQRKQTKPEVPQRRDRSPIKSPANISSAVARRNVQAMKTLKDKVMAEGREKMMSEDKTRRGREHFRKKGKTGELIRTIINRNTLKMQQYPGENSDKEDGKTTKRTKEEEKAKSFSLSKNNNQESHYSSTENDNNNCKEPYEFFHPRVWELKKAGISNADDNFRPIN